MVQAYCMTDRKNVEMIDPHEEMAKNGKPRLIGKCPICKGSVFKFIKTTAVKSSHVKTQMQKHAATHAKKAHSGHKSHKKH